MAFIKEIAIHQFRGIQQLTLSDFSDINLIVGDNNSGKTTILEAIQLLFAKPQLSSVKSVINQRTVLNRNNSSFYTSFIKMFNIEQDRRNLQFGIYANGNYEPISFEMKGHEQDISGEDALLMMHMSTREKRTYKIPSDFYPETAKLFTGRIIAHNGYGGAEKDIRCTSLDTSVPGPVARKEVQYISSFGHLRYDLLRNIVNNPEYKKLTIDILRQFDDSIADVCYTKADDGTYLETIITRDGISMPFSVYGDGIKKILYIMNKLYDATDSILMIDEIETGLHKKYYDTLFPVVFAVAKKLNVQLFIATHSIEAIDAILKYGNYERNTNKSDPIRVITLKKIQTSNGRNSNIVARNVTGRYVYENRKAFKFEVRL